MKVFERPGPINTTEVIQTLQDAPQNLKYLIVASVTGDSAVKAAERIKNRKIVCVTCPQGMAWEVNAMNADLFEKIPELRARRDAWLKQKLDRVPMGVTEENKQNLAAAGVEIVKGTIPLFGPSFSMRLHLRKTTALDVVAKTLELISTGTLVCLESVLMATDAGVIPEDELVYVCAGTEMGLDTAWIVKSCASANMYHPTKGFRFVELLCKPALAMTPNININYLR
ncbi:MAG TPA: hypothetical protein VLH35_06145 [Candidatus Acidoferrales bacterium]|nr:hypothetical protein [Candidatus Acidoferrales bacterium]